MLRKTRFQQVPLEVVKKVLKDEIKRTEETVEPEESNLAELKQQEKLLATAHKGRSNGTGRKHERYSRHFSRRDTWRALAGIGGHS